MRYYTLHRQSTKPKNKLQQAVLDLLSGYDSALVGDVEGFKSEVLEKIQELNNLHCRCTPLQPYWYRVSRPGVISFSQTGSQPEGSSFILHGLNSLATFSLHPVMKEIFKQDRLL